MRSLVLICTHLVPDARLLMLNNLSKTCTDVDNNLAQKTRQYQEQSTASISLFKKRKYAFTIHTILMSILHT